MHQSGKPPSYGNQYDEQKCPSAQQTPSRSGSFDGCRNKLGVHDLTGSVWEWVAQAQFAPKLNENSNAERYELEAVRGTPTAKNHGAEPLVATLWQPAMLGIRMWVSGAAGERPKPSPSFR